MTLYLGSQVSVERQDGYGSLSAIDQAATELFGDTRFRPSPHTMAALIQGGLTESGIVAAGRLQGFQRPLMDLTLADFEASLPHFQQMNDILADKHPENTILFAGRDAEVLYDDFAIAHPGTRSHLLPASSDLWDFGSGMDEHGLAVPFLSQYGITKLAAVGRKEKFVLVDSGFYGTIGRNLDRSVTRHYGVSLRQTGALAIQLVCANTDGIGTQIMDLPGGQFKVRIAKHDYVRSGKPEPDWAEGNTYPLAVGMQLMPRYYGPYSALYRQSDRVVALPLGFQGMVRSDVDHAGSVNSSNVNPVGAAITQFRTVSAALARAGRQIAIPGQKATSASEQQSEGKSALTGLGRLALKYSLERT